MYNVGWIVDGPYSPIDVLQSLERNSANHTPLYFVLLNLWGHLIGNDVALGRMISVFAGLLALAMVYRLSKDFVAPIAGLFAIIIVASNAFYNFYMVNLRMYTLLVLCSTIVCWVYLRIVQSERSVRRSDYVALFVASYAFANTHAISSLLFIALGAYHILHVSKDRRWLNVTIVIVTSLALFLPWAFVLLSQGVDRTYSSIPPERTEIWVLFGNWLSIMFAGSVMLLFLTLAGITLQLRASKTRHLRYHLILVYFLIASGIVAHFTEIVPAGRLRLTLAGFVPLQIFIALGMYGLYRVRKWLGMLALLWLFAGLSFHQTGYLTRISVRHFKLS